MTTAPLLALALVLPTAAPDAPDPTRPAPVPLDFRDRPTAEVVREIARRSGNDVEWLGAGFGSPSPPMTLVAAEPGPFWEAIDRLCAAARFDRTVVGPGPLGRSRTLVQLHGPAASGDAGPALYVGPLRLGNFELHAHHVRRFGPPTRLEAGPGPSFAQFRVRVEPRVIATLTGPPRRLEAIDDAGRDLLPPKLVAGELALAWEANDLEREALLLIPLAGPAEPGRRLKHLRGALPVELGLRPEKPELDIALADAPGKTFRAGDVALTIREYATGPGEPTRLKLSARIAGPRGDADGNPPGVVAARALNVLHRQLEFLDVRGRPAAPAAGSVGSPGGELRADLTYPPLRPESPDGPPTRLRLFIPRWVDWEAPFEFADLPLP